MASVLRLAGTQLEVTNPIAVASIAPELATPSEGSFEVAIANKPVFSTFGFGTWRAVASERAEDDERNF